MEEVLEPYIYDYYVGKLKYDVRPGKTVIGWAGRPQVINTLDIATILKQEHTYLLGWHEVYYINKPEQVKDQIVHINREKLVYKEHPFNSQLIMLATKLCEGLSTTSSIMSVPVIRSFERILFDNGWGFKWQVFENNLDFSIIVEQETLLRSLNSMEFKLLEEHYPGSVPFTFDELEKTMLELGISQNPTPPPVPVSAVPAHPQDALEQRLSRLENSMTKLITVLENNAKSDPAGHSELHTASAEREENTNNNHVNKASAAHSVRK